MVYTAVEVEVTTGPVVAIYQLDNRWEARPVYAFAIYRNPDDRGSSNYLVPLHQHSFTRAQDHYAKSARDVVALLPIALLENQTWWDLAQANGTGTAYLERNAAGEFLEAMCAL